MNQLISQLTQQFKFAEDEFMSDKFLQQIDIEGGCAMTQKPKVLKEPVLAKKNSAKKQGSQPALSKKNSKVVASNNNKKAPQKQ